MLGRAKPKERLQWEAMISRGCSRLMGLSLPSHSARLMNLTVRSLSIRLLKMQSSTVTTRKTPCRRPTSKASEPRRAIHHPRCPPTKQSRCASHWEARNLRWRS
ncbi:hypothetical protein FGO68_gene17532 [Halteria grandinella]|uniref:Uncharacterized protein n=1 Tax=Halteria grandinella TaxID=5974 RepID=A0A8J8ND62_HALGN|nr:hypothetical protein FGO68_gene17532 [Halteria grandinella]